MEARALGAVYGATRTEGERLPVGSAKTNVGHLEGAAGIVGLMKTWWPSTGAPSRRA